jgi:hypothetical protein
MSRKKLRVNRIKFWCFSICVHIFRLKLKRIGNLPFLFASFALVQIEPGCRYRVAQTPKIDNNPVSGISPVLEKGSELDFALKAFNLYVLSDSLGNTGIFLINRLLIKH